MKKFIFSATRTLLVYSAVMGAHADDEVNRQDKLALKLTERFTQSDTNGDGQLTREEAKEGRFRVVARKFDEIDTSRRGSVTLEQIKEYLSAKGQER